VGEEEREDDPTERRRQRGDDDERIQPRLEIHHDEQVEQEHGEDEAGQKPHVGIVHRPGLAAQREERAARERGRIFRDHFLHVAAHRAEIAILRRAVNVDHAADVVLRGALHLVRAIEAGDISEDLRRLAVAGHHRDVLDVVQRLHPVLRHLGHEVVVYAVLPIQEEHRRHLHAAAERIQYVARHLVLGEAGLQRLRAVHLDIEGGVIHRLLDPEIGQAGDLPEIGQHLRGDLVARIHVAALELDIDRRRDAEVQDLGDHIRRQEIEGGVWKLVHQLLAQDALVLRGRAMLRVQRDQHVLDPPDSLSEGTPVSVENEKQAN
jgi:hypothetical protein